MAEDATKDRIVGALRSGYFSGPDDLVDVSDGPDDNLHVVVVSRKLDGKRLREKSDLIWSDLVGKLDADDWRRVTLSVGVSPEDIKSL